MKRLLTGVAALAAAMLAGCAPSTSGSVYSRDQVRQEHSVRILSGGGVSRVAR